MKKFLLLALLSVSASSFATDFTIIKTVNPPIMTVYSIGSGSSLSQFYLSSSDFPSGTLGATKTLYSIDWTTASYPIIGGAETLDLCYYQPYTSSPAGCITVFPNSSGSTTAFNNYRFGNGSSLIITHRVTGTTQNIYYPSGKESVAFKYKY